MWATKLWQRVSIAKYANKHLRPISLSSMRPDVGKNLLLLI